MARKRKKKGTKKPGEAKRNWIAVAAWQRNGGPMADRRKERGGTRNLQREYAEQGEQ